MRQIHILHVPGSLLVGLAIHSLPEKRQFKSKPVAILGCHVSSEIPPLRLIVRMIVMIPRELKSIARQGGLVLGRGWQAKKEKRRPDHPLILHAPPPADRARPPPLPGRAQPGSLPGRQSIAL